MKTAIYHHLEVEVVDAYGYYALVRYHGQRFVVPLEDLTFQGGN